jgi:N-acetylglucosaminyldiphosphoundecaprenol N-acetyl-beta-D-mannosaminyltransferase
LTLRVPILNGMFDQLTALEAVETIFDALNSERRGWVCTVNVTTLINMRNDPQLQTFADQALVVVADGQPLVWSAPLFGGRLPERVAGIDLMDLLCQRAAIEGKGIYLLGARDQVLRTAMQKLRRRHPNLKIFGSNGYFKATESKLRADAIRASGASLLFVGMGTPRQEAFIRDHWEHLGVRIAVGVGGSFEVMAGLRLRAPRWLQYVGLEWLVRLLQEPGRLLPRYLKANSRFCLLIARATASRLKRQMNSS